MPLLESKQNSQGIKIKKEEKTNKQKKKITQTNNKKQLTDTKPLINYSSKTGFSQIITTAHYRKI